MTDVKISMRIWLSPKIVVTLHPVSRLLAKGCYRLCGC